MRALLLEYPEDNKTFVADDEFLFGKEILVAPVVKKGASSRKIYLPEGEWIDFNDGKTVYEGGQQISYKTPLSVIPIFVKRGSIIPMMPVMQYIHERKDYPLTLHIYPANEGQQASFTLYEDDGETTAYEKNASCQTTFTCKTQTDKFEIIIGERKSNGYNISGKRNYISKLHINSKPKKILVANKPVVFKPIANFTAQADKNSNEICWSWDAANGTCWIRFPDNGKEISVEVAR